MPRALELALLAAPMTIAAAAPPLAAAAEAFDAVVTYVVDGDSLWVRRIDPPRRMRLRLAGIDAPEICQPGGEPSRRALQALALGQPAQVTVLVRDRWGRAVAAVRVAGADVAMRQVAAGHAVSDARGDGRWPGPYAAQERAARRARVGQFTLGATELPAEFRRRHGPCKRSEGA